MSIDYIKAREILTAYSAKPMGKSFVSGEDSTIGGGTIESSALEGRVNIEYDLQVIIPAYNVEKYIGRCLGSVEKFLDSKYKVLIQIVDDGSTDNTGRLVDEWSSRHAGKAVEVIHQKNRGLSGARNSAMETIRGEYVMFIDSDDYIADTFELDKVFSAVQGCDIVQCNWAVVEGTDKVDTTDKVEGTDNTGAGERVIARGTPSGIAGYAWGKFYHHSILEKFRFPEGYLFEDTTVRFILSGLASRIKNLDVELYCYRKNTGGITVTASKKPKAVDSYWITELCLEEREKFGLTYDKQVYESFLRQAVVNELRIRKLPRKIRKAVFELTAELREKYFKDAERTTGKYKGIEKALYSGRFMMFELEAIGTRYRELFVKR